MMMIMIIINQGALPAPLGDGEWPEKDTMARFPSISLPVQKRWRAKSAMHYPAITAAIYIPPSITDTYYSPPAVQRAAPAPTHNFLKAAPYILIRQQLLCKCRSEGEDSEVTEGNQHHHFSHRGAGAWEPKEPPAWSCGATSKVLFQTSVADLKGVGEEKEVGRKRGRGINTARTTATFWIPTWLWER